MSRIHDDQLGFDGAGVSLLDRKDFSFPYDMVHMLQKPRFEKEGRSCVCACADAAMAWRKEAQPPMLSARQKKEHAPKSEPTEK